MGKKQEDKIEEQEELKVPKDPERSEEPKDSKDSEELEQLKKDLDSLKAQLQRAVADYQNLEKRVAEGRSELSNWASGEVIKKILPVADNIEKALKGASEDDKKSGWFKGVELSLKQLQAVLKDEGLGEVEADGQFDPALHEAVDMRDGEDGKVLEVVEKGYRLGGKILRPAKVVVGRKEN